MLYLGLAYFIPFESFAYPKLLYVITLRANLQGYLVRAYKDQNKGEDDSQYQLLVFMYYSLNVILYAFIVPDRQKFHVKK